MKGKHLESPYNMWIESQLIDGMQGLEHIALTNLYLIDPFGAMPNMGVNHNILTLLQQHHHALTSDILAHLDDGRVNALLPQDCKCILSAVFKLVMALTHQCYQSLQNL